MDGTQDNPIKLPEVYVTPMRVSPKGLELIHHFESLRLNAYLDPVNIPTIGWGNTTYENGKKVKIGDTITRERADELFSNILSKFERTVLSKISRPLKQHEFDAAVSFAYNAGTGYVSKGNNIDYAIWKHIQNGLSGNEMKKYWETLAITASGKKLNGLVRRRKAEVNLYLNNDLKFY